MFSIHLNAFVYKYLYLLTKPKMKNILFTAFILTAALLSCKKESVNEDQDEQPANAWTFKVQGVTYKGEFLWEPLLNTYRQENDTYSFGMLGAEPSSGKVFNIVMALADTTFTQKNYQSGISDTDAITAFYFSETVAGDDIYKSSNLDPGPVLNYKIESYDAATQRLVMTFQGNVQELDGNIVALTDGKVTCRVDKF